VVGGLVLAGLVLAGLVLAGLVPGVGWLFAGCCEDRKVSEGVQGVSMIQYAYKVIFATHKEKKRRAQRNATGRQILILAPCSQFLLPQHVHLHMGNTEQRQPTSCCCFGSEVSLHVPKGGKARSHGTRKDMPTLQASRTSRSATCHGAWNGTVAKATSDTFNHNYPVYPTP
jgi:hypothetical protein